MLKLIIENTHVRPEEIMSIDISLTMHALASFISRFDPQAALRLRLKFCVLCDAVCDRTDTLTLRKDSGARQKILDLVMEWMQTPPQVCSFVVAREARNSSTILAFFFYHRPVPKPKRAQYHLPTHLRQTPRPFADPTTRRRDYWG